MRAQQPVVVHGEAIARIETADPLEDPPADDHGRMIDVRHPGPDPLRIGRIATDPVQRAAGRVVVDQIAEHEVGAARLERGDRPLDLLRLQPVIGIHQADHLAARCRQALVEGVADATVGLADPTGQPAGVAPDDLEGAVGRGAVDHDVLDLGVGLREHAVDGAGQRRRPDCGPRSRC